MVERRRCRRTRDAPIDLELGADEQRELVLLRGYVGADDAGQVALVGDGKRGVAELLCAFDELLGLAAAADEGENGDAAESCVSGVSKTVDTR